MRKGLIITLRIALLTLVVHFAFMTNTDNSTMHWTAVNKTYNVAVEYDKLSGEYEFMTVDEYVGVLAARMLMLELEMRLLEKKLLDEIERELQRLEEKAKNPEIAI